MKWRIYRQRALKKTAFSEALVAIMFSGSIWEKSNRQEHAKTWPTEKAARAYLDKRLLHLDVWNPGFIYTVGTVPPIHRDKPDLEIGKATSDRTTDRGLWDLRGKLKRNS